MPRHRFQDFAGISEGQHPAKLDAKRDDPQHDMVTLKGNHSTETAGTDFRPPSKGKTCCHCAGEGKEAESVL